MKYFGIVIFLLPFFVQAEFFEKIDCGSYDASKYPNKREFKGLTISSIEDVGIEEFISAQSKLGQKTELGPDIILKLVDRNTGKYEKSFLRRSPNVEGGTAVERQIIQPDLIVNLDGNLLAGSNNGEFGGELVLIDANDRVVLIGEMNVEDIYEMPFGLVVTSGIAHMMSNEGEVNLITNQFKLTKLFSLIGMPKSSWKLNTGDLLINSYPSGSQVLTKSGYLKRVECIANKSSNTDAASSTGS